MAKLHMTIDPSFTHRVVEILNEKLWDGDIDGIHRFMEESFSITNHKLIAKILAGKYVMVFNEDGSGNIKPREEVTKDEEDAMMGLPDELGVKEIREAIRCRVAGSTGFLERQKYVILNFRDIVVDIYKTHLVNLGSRVLDSEVAKVLGSVESEVEATTYLTTQEIISIYNNAKENDASMDVIKSIKDANGDAARLIYIMDEVDKLFHEQANLIKAMDYIKEYIFDDIRNIDIYKDNGDKASFDELIENPGSYYWMQDFHSRCSEINEYYQFLLADSKQQKLMSDQAKANEMITHAAVHDMSDFIHDKCEPKHHDTGNPLLDAYLESAMSEHPSGPVKPEADKWDAGWISPEGAFWASKGSKADFLHLNLADSIKEYYKGTFAWLANTENPDHELEKHGWLKFHHNEVMFLGYRGLTPDNLSQHSITMRQVDKLYDYAKHMGFDTLYVAVTEKEIVVAEMYNYTKDEWQTIFKW